MNWIITKDLLFWLKQEKKIKTALEKLGFIVETTSATSILDYKITKKWKLLHIELKSRRCNSNTYEDTMIWANKISEAFSLFYSKWEYTMFLFNFIDWLYYINPFNGNINKTEYKAGRYDRGIFDKPKGWLYFNNLKKLC